MYWGCSDLVCIRVHVYILLAIHVIIHACIRIQIRTVEWDAYTCLITSHSSYPRPCVTLSRKCLHTYKSVRTYMYMYFTMKSGWYKIRCLTTYIIIIIDSRMVHIYMYMYMYIYMFWRVHMLRTCIETYSSDRSSHSQPAAGNVMYM